MLFLVDVWADDTQQTWIPSPSLQILVQSALKCLTMLCTIMHFFMQWNRMNDCLLHNLLTSCFWLRCGNMCKGLYICKLIMHISLPVTRPPWLSWLMKLTWLGRQTPSLYQSHYGFPHYSVFAEFFFTLVLIITQFI